jgi:two-component system chemotaxis response regulator CheB
MAAIFEVLSGLPADFAAPVLLVLHLDPYHKSHLVGLLARRTALHVVAAEEGVQPEPGAVYVAPPDFHLTVDAARNIRLTQSPRTQFVRPSGDVLFRSLAEVYGPRVVGVILTGTGADGSDGLSAIQEHGGVTIAQDEATSQYFGMPGEAARRGLADQVLPLPAIAGRLVELVGPGNAAR